MQGGIGEWHRHELAIGWQAGIIHNISCHYDEEPGN
jgi:hypothetical protein